MRILVVCNTPFQLITALNIVNHNYENAELTFVISDYFKDSDIIAKRIKKTYPKYTVVYASVMEKIKNGKNTIYKGIFSPRKLIDEYDCLDDYNYDYFLFNNFDIFSSILYYRISKENDHIIASRYEEGYSSYFDNLNQQKSCAIFDRLGKIRNGKSLSYDVKEYWYYYPEFALYKHSVNDILKTIPVLSRDERQFVSCLNSIFLSEDSNMDMISTRIIFFEDAFFYNGEDIGDVEIVEMISNIVGKNNIKVKLHPRSNCNRFTKLNLDVEKKVGVPWEIHLLNNTFDGRVLITVASGSVLSSKLYFSDDVKIIYLYKCTKHRPRYITDEFEKHLKKITEKFGDENVIIPNNITELQNYLKTNFRAESINIQK